MNLHLQELAETFRGTGGRVDLDAVELVVESDAVELMLDLDAVELVLELNAVELVVDLDAVELVVELDAGELVVESNAVEPFQPLFHFSFNEGFSVCFREFKGLCHDLDVRPLFREKKMLMKLFNSNYLRVLNYDWSFLCLFSCNILVKRVNCKRSTFVHPRCTHI